MEPAPPLPLRHTGPPHSKLTAAQAVHNQAWCSDAGGEGACGSCRVRTAGCDVWCGGVSKGQLACERTKASWTTAAMLDALDETVEVDSKESTQGE